MNAKTAWFAALVALLLGLLIVEYQQFRVLKEIVSAMAVTTTPTSASTGVLVHSFRSDGVTYYVVTTKGELDPSETTLHWERRHLDDIQAAWQEHTPD